MDGWEAKLFVGKGLEATLKGGDSMKTLIKHPIKMALVFFSLLLLSCATTGQFQRYTQGSIIDMESYSITGPPGDGWFVKIQGGLIEFSRPATPSGSDKILVFGVWSDMMEKEDRYPSAEEKAFEFIKHREESAREHAKKGDCVLNDVKKGTTMIGEKKLHFISTKTSGWREGPARRATLFHVFFPANFNERHTYYCLYLLQFRDKESPLESADLTLIQPVIESLKIKPQIEVEAKNAETYLHWAFIHAKKKDYGQAIYYLNKAIEMDPKNPWPYNARGAIYMAEGRYDRAISSHTKALEIDPKNAAFYCNRAIVYCLKEQYDEAILDCNKALEIDPRDGGAYNERGIAYARKGQHDQAISDYTKALEIDQKYALKAYLNRGISYADKGEYDQAISDFSKAIEINPKYADAYRSRGVAYYFKKEYSKSWDDIKKAENLGCPIPSEFLDDLRKASGRQK